MVRFPRKAKTPIVKGVGEDREVAVPGTPKARAVTFSAKKKSTGIPKDFPADSLIKKAFLAEL
jgi:hypothetical protein